MDKRTGKTPPSKPNTAKPGTDKPGIAKPGSDQGTESAHKGGKAKQGSK